MLGRPTDHGIGGNAPAKMVADCIHSISRVVKEKMGLTLLNDQGYVAETYDDLYWTMPNSLRMRCDDYRLSLAEELWFYRNVALAHFAESRPVACSR